MKFKIKNKEIIPFIIITLYPIIWYTVLANHTIHYYFTYRHILLFMVGLLLIINKIIFSKQEK